MGERSAVLTQPVRLLPGGWLAMAGPRLAKAAAVGMKLLRSRGCTESSNIGQR